MGTEHSNGLKVTFYQRRPRNNRNFSVENYFNAMRNALAGGIICCVSVCKYESSGFFKRLYNSIEAIWRQGDVNHITGDVHYLAYFLKKRKTILTVLDCGRMVYLKGIKFKLFRYFWFVLPAKKSAYITTISTATKQDLLKYIHYDPEKIFVIPVCISPVFSRVDKPFNAQRPRILQLGTAINKNLERLVLSLKNITCELVIVGVVPQNLQNLIAQTNIHCITFLKSLTEQEIVEEYIKADIITLISTIEGFGMPIVEGNTVGRVVITGNITSMPEVAANAAHLADPYSVDSMREGFEKIISDEAYRNTLITNGYENCRRFLPKTIAVQFSSIYKAIGKN